MKIQVFILSALLLLPTGCVTSSSIQGCEGDLHKFSDGNKINFNQEFLEHSDSSFLIPSTWKREQNLTATVDAYLFSPSFNKPDFFSPKFEGKEFGHKLGFQIMVYKGLFKNSGEKPTAVATRANEWVLNVLKAKLHVHGSKTTGPFKGSIVEYSSLDDKFQFYEMHLGVDSTDTLWVLTFRSPKAEWENNWKQYGEVIFKNIRLDDEY